MRLLTNKQLDKAKDLITYAYIQNLQEEKSLDDCISMNRKLSWISRTVLGRHGRDIPDVAMEIMRKERYEKYCKAKED